MAKTIQEKLIKKLQKLEEYISAYQENKDILVSFIEKYIECEICYKALLLAYRTEKKQDIKESSLKINLADAKKIGSFANVGVVKSICKQVQTAAYQGSNHGISATGGFTSHGYSCRNRVSFVN